MVLFKELELGWGISAKGADGGHGGGLERLDILMRVTVDHPINKRVFTPFDFDVFGWFVISVGQMDVERDVVQSLIQDEALCWWEPIICPSNPLVSILPCVG